MTALFLYNVVMRFGILLIIFFITGCASAPSPEQLQARAIEKTDYDLCYEVARVQWFNVVMNEYDKAELTKRRVDCNVHATAIYEQRQKEIMWAQTLIAFGNAVKANQPQAPAPITLPDYGNPNPSPTVPQTTFLYFLDNSYEQGTQKVCVYKNMVHGVRYEVLDNKFSICPASKRY